MRFLGDCAFSRSFFDIFFRERGAPDGALIFLMLLPFTLLEFLGREPCCGTGKRSSSSRKTPLFEKRWKRLGGVSEGMFVGSALPGVFIVLLSGKGERSRSFPF